MRWENAPKSALLHSGKRFRSFNVIDDFNRESLNITIDKSLTSLRIIRELNQLISWRLKLEKICLDNGPEFIAHAMEDSAQNNGIELRFKGKPHQNGYIERFNKSYREEVLDVYAFNNLKKVRELTKAKRLKVKENI